MSHPFRLPDKKIKVLFMAEAITLAHVSRLAVLMRSLDPEKYEVLFACDPRFNEVMKLHGPKIRSISSITTQSFSEAIIKGKPIYDFATLKGYVETDLQLIQDFQPHVIVGDFRLSLAVSARIARIPYLNLTNAYWSPFSHFRLPVPDLPVVKVLGHRFVECVFNAFESVFLKAHSKAINQLISHFGLSLPKLDMWEFYTHGDWTLYADLPGVVPTESLPSHHRFIGPIIWNPQVERPLWWDHLPKQGPLVYVTMGSSGDCSRLPQICEALLGMGATTLLATAGKSSLQTNVQEKRFVANYLAGEDMADLADLVICNGGSPTSYQALSKGVPVLGFPSNLDQYLNMSLLQKAGAGKLLRTDSLQTNQIQNAVSEILDQDSYKLQAHRLQIQISQQIATDEFQKVLTEIAS
jgi:UDP:flavonoid glycosyltransferase YjiC (YdhE family)